MTTVLSRCFHACGRALTSRLLAGALSIATGAATTLATDGIYWADNFALRHCDLSGSNQTSVWPVGSLDIAIDVAAGKMYWGDNSTSPARIMRGNLDGTGTPTVLVNAPLGERVHHLEIDTVNQFIYWDDFINLHIYRTDINNPLTPAPLPLAPGTLRDIALDTRPSKQHLYYTDGYYVFRSNLDGTSPVQLTYPLGPDINGIAIDTCKDYIFAVGKTFPHPGVPEHYVRRADLADCGNLITLLQAPAGYPGNVGLDPYKIVLDSPRRQMYWTAETGDLQVQTQLHKANCDGTSPQVIVQGTSAQRFRGLAIELDDTQCPPSSPSGSQPAPAWAFPGNFVAAVVHVGPGLNPTSTGISVTCDLSMFDLAAAHPLFDDGTHGDVIAGDNIFTSDFMIPATAAPGARNIPFTITDAESRTGSGTLTIGVEGSTVCINDLFQYSGPRNTAELTTLLMTSQDPVLLDLNSGIKSSLIRHMYFNHGIARGMLGSDSNIQQLYASNAAAVFSAIYGMPTLLYTHGSGPVFQEITRAQLIANHPGYTTVASYCENCDIPRCAGETCCTVPGAGCCDYYAMSGSQLFKVTDVSACSAYTPPCGTSDFNGDSDFGTDSDIEAFFACLAGNCCPTCFSGGSDFNADGDYGTDADIESFFRVLSGGPC